MVIYTAFSSGISAYWPLLLVGICGIVLVVIAIMALLLLKGSDNLSALRAVLEKNEQFRRNGLDEGEIYVQFFRIGRDGVVQKVKVEPQKWFTVGSGDAADICLDSNDPKLAEKHFRIHIKGEILSVSTLELETFVNGVPITKLGAVQAYSGDLIRAGSHEYRVIFSRGEERENAT